MPYLVLTGTGEFRFLPSSRPQPGLDAGLGETVPIHFRTQTALEDRTFVGQVRELVISMRGQRGSMGGLQLCFLCSSLQPDNRSSRLLFDIML